MATDTRNPTSDGTVTGTWSGSAGSRYTVVADYPDAAGRLTAGTATSTIQFGYSAFTVPAGSTSISVQVQYYDGEAANGTNNVGGRIVVGGTAYNATTHNPSGTTGTARSDNWATNPKSTVAWTVDDVNGVGTNALQGFGINSTDSNPTFFIGSIRLQVTYTPPQNAARVSFGEFEAPTAPRRLKFSFAEGEVPTAPRRSKVSVAELEAPDVSLGRKALVSWAEAEVGTAPRRVAVSVAELEVGTAPRSARLSVGELEAPTAPRKLQFSWMELEAGLASRATLLSIAEVEYPSAPRRLRVSWAGLEIDRRHQSKCLPNAMRISVARIGF